MEVYAFVGESGCGKSFRALWVAQQHNIAAIIDDGLLISKNKIIAGVSAKRETTKIAAVKRALFRDSEHCLMVKNALQMHAYDKLLVIGTSDGMVEHIAERLNLPKILKTIYIRDIATEEEINIAKNIRRIQGKHIIPVPTFEIKKDFSGYLIDSITLNFFRRNKKTSQPFRAEKSIVRPTFSYLGDYTISDNVIADICTHEAKKNKQFYKVYKSIIESSAQGITISVDLALNYGKYSISHIAHEIANNVAIAIERYTSINVCEININIKSLHIHL